MIFKLKLLNIMLSEDDGNNGGGGEGGEITDEIIDDNLGGGETGDETLQDEFEGEKEPYVFDPDKMEFEPEELEEPVVTEFSGYSLEKYKDTINLSDPQVKENLENLAKEYKGANFSQEQIEFMLDREIKAQSENKITDEQIKEDLSKRLDLDTKRNWGTLTKKMNEVFEKNPSLAAHKKGFMGNPILMNIMNSVLNANTNGVSDTLAQKDNTVRTKVYTSEGAYEEMYKQIKAGHENPQALAKELVGKVRESERATFKSLINGYLQ